MQQRIVAGMADNNADQDARLGEALIEAFGATTSLFDPRVGNAEVGVAVRDQLRLLGFDIVPLGSHAFPLAAEFAKQEEPGD